MNRLPGAKDLFSDALAAGSAAVAGAVKTHYSRPYEHAYMLQRDFITSPHTERMQLKRLHEERLLDSTSEAPLHG